MNIIDFFNIPNKAKTNKRIFVKEILSRLDISSKDKSKIEKTIDGIYVKGILNENTTNIWSYMDDTYFYKEIIILNVKLKDYKNITFVNEQLHKVFLNPIIIIYEFNKTYSISTALKRLNKLEKGKTVIEEIQISNFFKLDENHMRLLNVNSFNANSLKNYYQKIHNIVITEELVNLTGIVPEEINENVKEKAINIKQLIKQKKELENAYKEADSMQERMSIHIKIKEIEKELEGE